MTKIKRYINQEDFKIVDLHMLSNLNGPNFYLLDVVDRVSETQLQV